MDPTRQHEQNALDSRGNLVTSASLVSTAVSIPSFATGDSSSSFNSSIQGSTGGGGGGSGGEGRLAKSSSAAWQRPSGRSLGAAAAAFGHDESGSEAGDSEFNGGDGVSNLSGVDSTFSAGQSGFSMAGAAAYLNAEDDEDDAGVGFSSEQAGAMREASYDADLAATAAAAGSLVPSASGKSADLGDAAVLTTSGEARQASLPPSGRPSTAGSTRQGSYDPAPVPGAKVVAAAAAGERSRTASHGSGDLREELRELTDEERQVRMQESDAARAASLLRGASFRVPLQPDLAHAITEAEQVILIDCSKYFLPCVFCVGLGCCCLWRFFYEVISHVSVVTFVSEQQGGRVF